MKSAIFAHYNLFGTNVYMCYDYVHLDNLSDIIHQSEVTTVIHRILFLMSSPQSAPVARSIAMYRDPLTGPIGIAGTKLAD